MKYLVDYISIAKTQNVFLWFILRLLNLSAKKLFSILKKHFLIYAFISMAAALIVEEFLLSSWAYPSV
jgi:hypothetical protein